MKQIKIYAEQNRTEGLLYACKKKSKDMHSSPTCFQSSEFDKQDQLLSKRI